MGDAICIFQEDNERGINSSVILLSIMMLIFHIKGQRASGVVKGSLSALPRSPTPHCILISGGRRAHVGAGSTGKKLQSLCSLALPSLPVLGMRFTIRPPNRTHSYSFWWCQIWLELPYHGDACAQSECPEATSQEQSTEPGPAHPRDSHPLRPRPSGANFSAAVVTLQ